MLQKTLFEKNALFLKLASKHVRKEKNDRFFYGSFKNKLQVQQCVFWRRRIFSTIIVNLRTPWPKNLKCLFDNRLAVFVWVFKKKIKKTVGGDKTGGKHDVTSNDYNSKSCICCTASREKKEERVTFFVFEIIFYFCHLILSMKN